MASEFDEALIGFLLRENVSLRVQGAAWSIRGERGHKFVVTLMQGGNELVSDTGRPIAGDGESLDDAINRAVEALPDEMLANQPGVPTPWVRDPKRYRLVWTDKLGHEKWEAFHTEAAAMDRAEELRAWGSGFRIVEMDEAHALEPNRRWSTAYKNSLPDSAFLYVREDCVEYVDEQGRSHPLDCRELPVKNRSGSYDYAHVKNAISRAVQLKDVPKQTQRELQAEARSIFEREFGGS